MTGEFGRILELVFAKNPLQKKTLEPFLSNAAPVYWERAEEFARQTVALLEAKGLDAGYLVDAYLKLCADMLREQILFHKTGAYSTREASQAYENVYSQPDRMAAYMHGLALSQFLWPNHYAMYDFFLTQSAGLADVSSILEIGPGHGLYLSAAARLFPQAALEAIDISPVSLAIARQTVEHMAGPGRCGFLLAGVEDLTPGARSYIILGEVLEHLDDPAGALTRIRTSLAPGGRLFLTTCANCPAIDHVYLFESVGHIRQELTMAGFAVEAELALAARNALPREGGKHEVNYAAILFVPA
jgi:2-polyprenyl-3-methyl-5-hydroxy-6-metoxy-1,4-benzoquinol methylase